MILNNIDNLIILIENKYKILYDLGKNSLEELDDHPLSQYVKSKIGIGFKDLSFILSLAGVAFTLGKITYSHFTSIRYKISKLKKLKQQLKKDKNNFKLKKEIQELEEYIKKEQEKLKQITNK